MTGKLHESCLINFFEKGVYYTYKGLSGLFFEGEPIILVHGQLAPLSKGANCTCLCERAEITPGMYQTIPYLIDREDILPFAIL